MPRDFWIYILGVLTLPALYFVIPTVVIAIVGPVMYWKGVIADHKAKKDKNG